MTATTTRNPLSLRTRSLLRDLQMTTSQVTPAGRLMWLDGRKKIVGYADIDSGFLIVPRGAVGVMLSRADYDRVMGGG